MAQIFSGSIDHSSIAIKVSLSEDVSIFKKKFGHKLHVTIWRVDSRVLN